MSIQPYNTTFNRAPSKEETLTLMQNDMMEFIKSVSKIVKDYRFDEAQTPQFKIDQLIFGPICAGREVRKITPDVFHTLFYNPKIAKELGYDKPTIDPIFRYIDFKFRDKGWNWNEDEDIGSIVCTYSNSPVVLDPVKMVFSIGKDKKLKIYEENRKHYITANTTSYGATVTNMILLVLANRDEIRRYFTSNLQNREAEYQDGERAREQRSLEDAASLANQYLIARAQRLPF